MTRRAVHGDQLRAPYWAANLRKPVLAADVFEGLLTSGYTRFIEVSPHPVLCDSIMDSAFEMGVDVAAIPTLRNDSGDLAVLMKTAASFYRTGRDVDWRKLSPPENGSFVSILAYPCQGHSYWFTGSSYGVEAE